MSIVSISSNVERRVRAFIDREGLLSDASYPLLTVSGGRDSMMLLALFHKLGIWEFGVAHFNFQLRGEESLRDMEHVRIACQVRGISLHLQTVDTYKWCEEHKCSIQVGCRVLRYDFFEALSSTYGYTEIVTAHHAEDQAETVLFNLVRGGGLEGVRGMRPRNGKLIRPLLILRRSEIEAWLVENGVQYVEDSTNASDKYTRNAIRHHVIPPLETVNKQAVVHINTFANFAAEAYRSLQTEAEQLWGVIAITSPFVWDYAAENVRAHPGLATFWLRERLQFLHFSEEDIEIALYAFPSAQTGKKITTGEWDAVYDRGKLEVYRVKSVPPQEVYMSSETSNAQQSISFAEEVFHEALAWENRREFLQRGENCAVLDCEKVYFPLILRTWQAGDVFTPLGMLGKKKKVSDFLTDIHYPTHLRQRVQVLEDAQRRILWVVGLRLAEVAAVSKTTREIFVLTYKQ